MRKPTYKVSQHPKDRRYYVMGACGNGKYMQITDGFATRGAAAKRMRHLVAAAQSAKAELGGWDGWSVR